MDKTSINYNKLLKTFKDKWVATSGDYSKVFASGASLKSVMGKIKDTTKIKMFRVGPLDMIYSPKTE